MPKPPEFGSGFQADSSEAMHVRLDVFRAMLLQVLDDNHERQPGWAMRQETLLTEILQQEKLRPLRSWELSSDDKLGTSTKRDSEDDASLQQSLADGIVPGTDGPGGGKGAATKGFLSPDKGKPMLSNVSFQVTSDCPSENRSPRSNQGFDQARTAESLQTEPENRDSGYGRQKSRFKIMGPKLSITRKDESDETDLRGRVSKTTIGEEAVALRPLMVLVESKYFEVTCALVVVADIVCNGVLAQLLIAHAVQNIGTGGSAEINFAGWCMEASFLVCYSVELTLKLLAMKMSFFIGPVGLWNSFDLFLVLATGIGLAVTSSGTSFTYLRIARIFKQIMKALRVLRVVKYFEDLRIIMLSIARSMRSFFWAVVTLVLLMYMCAIIFVEGIASHLHSTAEDELSPSLRIGVEQNWDSLARAMLTEYKSITGGAPWGSVTEPLEAAGTSYFLIFLFYIALLVIAVLRLLTGIFVQQAAAAAKLDTERAIEQNIINFFHKIDDDNSGAITYEEFKTHFKDKEAVSYLQNLQITPHDADKIFRLMDRELAQSVDINEFIAVLQNFKGAARKIDVALIQGWVKEIALSMGNFMEYVEQVFESNYGECASSTRSPYKERSSERGLDADIALW